MNKRFVYIAILSLLTCIPLPVHADESPLKLMFGSVKTEAEKAALQYAIKYAEALSEEKLLNPTINADKTRGSLWSVAPEIDVKSGEADTFSSIQVNVTANYMNFATMTPPGGTPLPDLNKLAHVLPVSFGLESDRTFNDVAALLEFGYVPYMDFGEAGGYLLGRNPKLGLFAQVGYKAKIDDKSAPEGAAIPSADGAADQSEEESDSMLARIKASAATDYTLFTFDSQTKAVSVEAEASVWYDIVDATTYDREVVALKLHLSKDKSFDFKYEHGSGAPNFNKGTQFSTNITVAF
jgi:hypothetical protein